MFAVGLRCSSSVPLSSSRKQTNGIRNASSSAHPKPSKATAEGHAFEAPVLQAGLLSNGIKVITVKNQQPNLSIGLFVRSGTRFENSHTAGASFFLKRLAFTSSQFMHDLRVVRELELMGGNFSVSVGREEIAYTATVPPPKADSVIPILRSASEPRFLDFEIKDTRENVESDLENASRDPLPLLFDLLHQTAYRGKGLGQTFFAPFNVEHLGFHELFNFRYGTFLPERTVLVAVGADIDHGRFLAVANSEFQRQAQLPAGSLEKARHHHTSDVPSTYVGGESLFTNSADTHVAIGFQGASFADKEIHAFRTLQFLLGGGKAQNSKEGLGHGAAGPLYRNIVEKNKSVKETGAFNFNYSDSGLFGVYGIAERGTNNASQLVTSLARELQSVANNKPDSTGIERAKNQFKASILFNTDTTESYAQFIGSAALLAKQPQDVKTPNQSAELVNAITPDDIQKVAKKIISQQPTVAAIGDIAGLPSLSKIFSK